MCYSNLPKHILIEIIRAKFYQSLYFYKLLHLGPQYSILKMAYWYKSMIDNTSDGEMYCYNYGVTYSVLD